MADTTCTIATCSGCQRERKARPNKAGGVKTPMGWRSIDDALLCGECVASRYYTRGFRVEIRGLADGEERTMQEFRAALSAAANATARLANWYVQQLWAADLACAPALGQTKDGKAKLPPCPQVDYYRPATRAFPELAPASIVAVARMVRGWYSADRFAALVALNRSVRSYRFGSLPVEIPQQAWSLRLDEDAKKFVVRTQVGPGKSWPVAIYADAINLTRLRQIHEGRAVPLALKLVRAAKLSYDGVPRKAWFFRISAMFPRAVPRRSHQEITLTLGHDRGSLLFGAIEGRDDVYEFPGEALRTLVVGGDIADRRRQREASMARDQWSRRKARRFARGRSVACENRARKIADQIKLAASSLAKFCRRHGVTSVDYDTTDHQFVPHFPWHALRSAIHDALEREGIALHVISESEEDTKSPALAGPKRETEAAV